MLRSGIIMDLTFHENIIYFPVKKAVAICGYDNEYDILYEIANLACYVQEIQCM